MLCWREARTTRQMRGCPSCSCSEASNTCTASTCICNHTAIIPAQQVRAHEIIPQSYLRSALTCTSLLDCQQLQPCAVLAKLHLTSCSAHCRRSPEKPCIDRAHEVAVSASIAADILHLLPSTSCNSMFFCTQMHVPYTTAVIACSLMAHSWGGNHVMSAGV